MCPSHFRVGGWHSRGRGLAVPSRVWGWPFSFLGRSWPFLFGLALPLLGWGWPSFLGGWGWRFLLGWSFLLLGWGWCLGLVGLETSLLGVEVGLLRVAVGQARPKRRGGEGWKL